MNKKTIFLILILVAVAGILFYVIKFGKSNVYLDEKDLAYQEPITDFFDSGQLNENDVVVKVTDLGFEPADITVKKGQKVTWVNEFDGYAWPASDPHPTHTNKSGFDAELPMKENQAWSFAFDKAGDWKYHDHLNPTKRGVVRVSE